MSIRPPTAAEVRSLADRFHFDLTDEEIEVYRELIAESLDAYESVRDRGRVDRPPEHERTGGHRVGPDEDPHNAYITRCEVVGPGTGRLAGWDVAVKDNVAVAGIECTCGSRVLEGYVPATDATVVRRLLDAGARVVGKANMDDMAFAGTGDTGAFGPTLNPHDPSRLAGGSSGGSAIAVATGDADAAIGTDQGGSIRAPAAWCGVVGHKPTHGLVPYTGCIGHGLTIDHVGPMAADVERVAEVLSVLAGRDGLDPRQPERVPEVDYAAGLDGDPADLSVGVVAEGFDRPGAEGPVNENVRAALDALEDRGATVEGVSVPLHAHAHDAFTVSTAESVAALLESEGVGYDHGGHYDLNWAASFARARRGMGGAFPPGLKLTVLLGCYAGERTPTAHAAGMNLRRMLREVYDDRLDAYDVLAMPTTPQRAVEHDPDADLESGIKEIDANLLNTAAFDLTGHPAVSVPVDPADGLPVGLMFVGPRFEDGTVLDAARAVEGLASEG